MGSFGLHQLVIAIIVIAVLAWLFSRSRFDGPVVTGGVRRSYWAPRPVYDVGWGVVIAIVVLLLVLGYI